MPSLNPYLRAFFRSTLPSQCTPVDQHILLVPTTEVLLVHKDLETNTSFLELAATEEFLGSHVLKVGQPGGQAKEIGSVRDNRGKAKQFTTLNGRTLVVKESYVYSNKGFKNLNQAQLLSDALYYHDGLEPQQWLIYYISKPLVGTLDPIKAPAALLLDPSIKPQAMITNGADGTAQGMSPGKKDVKTFNELLNNFPMIARQMQPGLERVFKEFNKDVGKPLPALGPKSPSPRPRRASASSISISSRLTSKISDNSHPINGHMRSSSVTSIVPYAEDEEDHMRRTLETAVTAAIDLFQLVDKQQLSLLGATTDLTGPLVERLIERYVTGQLHDAVLFPRLCNIHQSDDDELESRIHHMMHIDIAQVGMKIEGGRNGKQQLTSRLGLGVEEFRKLGVTGSPQQMIDILLETQKIITMTSPVTDLRSRESGRKPIIQEKPRTMTMNADTLVSLLLVVVIRSHVRHLQARLAYMRNFIFIDDVEGGEMGYALSTFEAVLSYLSTDSGGLRVASRRNKRLWQATKKGNLSEMKSILEPSSGSISEEDDSIIDVRDKHGSVLNGLDNTHEFNISRLLNIGGSASHDRLSNVTTEIDTGLSSNLAHVFPFQSTQLDSMDERPKSVKRVSLDLRSMSGTSEYSFRSRTSTVTSRASGIEGDTSIEKLCQTQDTSGDSVLMMAVEAKQPEALAYLLSLEEYYPSEVVLEDCNSDGTTLLSAAVQNAHAQLINIFVEYLFDLGDPRRMKDYITRQDIRGRTFAHYLFNAPHLIHKFGTLTPWRQKDKNGQTPLLALCRSYDHPKYLDMVNSALNFAMDEQGDNQRLHMDNHVEGKGNTLLHVVSDPYLALRILQHCDADPNAPNNKRFTPLMVASKFGRFEMVRAMFLDNRVDIQAKEHRGMTAVELAKDDEVRNRIDDMMLVSNVPAPDGRVTAVVRSFFVEDATIRVIIKTAARSGDGMIAVTTCRRSLEDFENLAKWLSIEHPASWLPSISNFRSPFQIPSKPSRVVLGDIQVRLDKFLKIMLTHSTFSTHELVWEFILVPEIQPEMMAERSLKKADIRAEKVKEEYEPVEDVRDVEVFVAHARESIRAVNHSNKSVTRRVNGIRNASTDFSVALEIATKPLAALDFLSLAHSMAFTKYTKTLQIPESDPYKLFHQDLQAISSTILAMLSSLSRPHALINSLQGAQKNIDRHRGSLRRSDRWPLGLLDETRKSIHFEAMERMERARDEARSIACELRYTQQTVAAELAGWQDLHGKMARRAIRKLVEGMVVKEKDKLDGMRRAMREIVVVKEI